MASPTTASVVRVDVLAPANGQKIFVSHNIDKGKLCFYSIKADKHFQPEKHGISGKRAKSRYSHLSRDFLLPKDVNIAAAGKVASLINGADLDSPAQVSICPLGANPTMQKAVEIHRVACVEYEFRQSLISDDIRDFVHQQIYETIPNLATFKLIVDRMAFDKGVVFNMMDRAESTKIAKTLEPEVYEAIVKYAEKTGWGNCFGGVGEED